MFQIQAGMAGYWYMRYMELWMTTVFSLFFLTIWLSTGRLWGQGNLYLLKPSHA